MPQRHLIFGGTFDPPHLAHAQLPPLAAARLGCERLIYVPAAINPLKADHPPTPAPHRLAMLRLALRDVPNAEISTVELDREGPSYTVDTLEALRDELGHAAELHLLIGADQALEFHRWKDWQRILELATPAVMLRTPWTRESFAGAIESIHGQQAASRWSGWVLDLPVVDVSATYVREQLQSGAATIEGLDPAVAAYAREHSLYASGPGRPTMSPA